MSSDNGSAPVGMGTAVATKDVVLEVNDIHTYYGSIHAL